MVHFNINHIHESGGGTRMARGGIRLVHGHTKSTLITYFSGMKIDPKYGFLHAFFLICPSCPFQNFVYNYDQKHAFYFFPSFARVCTPKRCTRVQCLVLKNNHILREFLDEPDTPLTFEWPPGAMDMIDRVTNIYIQLTKTTPLVERATGVWPIGHIFFDCLLRNPVGSMHSDVP